MSSNYAYTPLAGAALSWWDGLRARSTWRAMLEGASTPALPLCGERDFLMIVLFAKEGPD